MIELGKECCNVDIDICKRYARVGKHKVGEGEANRERKT